MLPYTWMCIPCCPGVSPVIMPKYVTVALPTPPTICHNQKQAHPYSSQHIHKPAVETSHSHWLSIHSQYFPSDSQWPAARFHLESDWLLVSLVGSWSSEPRWCSLLEAEASLQLPFQSHPIQHALQSCLHHISLIVNQQHNASSPVTRLMLLFPSPRSSMSWCSTSARPTIELSPTRLRMLSYVNEKLATPFTSATMFPRSPTCLHAQRHAHHHQHTHLTDDVALPCV